MGDLTGAALMLSIPAYFLLQWQLGRRWTGGWRLLALAPLVVMVPVFIHAALAFAAQSNLWPLLLIFAAPLAFLYLLALAGVRGFARHTERRAD